MDNKYRLENIKYNVWDQDVEMLIPPNNVTSIIEEKDGNVLKLVLKLVIGLSLVVMLSTILLYGYLYICRHELHSVRGAGDSCVPLQSVDKVTVSLVEGHNYSCHDNTSCTALLQIIEDLHNGSSYNFVIGSGMELYIGLGFKCRVNSHLNDLHIKLLWSDDTFVGETNRLINVIDEGLKCGYIFRNYSIRYLCDGNETHCIEAAELMNETYHFNATEDNRSDSTKLVAGHTFHSSTSDTGMILHKAFRWTLCGKASHEAKNLTKSKVITLESLPRKFCLPFRPVDQIDVYVVYHQLLDNETNNFNCEDETCDNVINYIESQHDGHNYNFVIGSMAELYITLGFKCSVNGTEKSSLKIKLLVKDDDGLYTYSIIRLAELINQGLVCRKILENYSIISYNLSDYNSRSIDLEVNIFRFVEDHKYIASIMEKRWGSLEFNYHSNTEAKIVPYTYKIMACAKKHLPGESETWTNIRAGTTTEVSLLETTTDDSNCTTTLTYKPDSGDTIDSSTISRTASSIEEEEHTQSSEISDYINYDGVYY